MAQPPRPPKRGTTLLVVLLSVGLVAATTVAVVSSVRLRSAEERIEELEGRPGESDRGNPFEDLFRDALGEVPDLLDDLGLDLFGCLSGEGPGSIETPTGAPGEQVSILSDQVEDLRGLEFRDPVDPEFLSDRQTRARVRSLFLEDYTEDVADAEGRVLSALGAIPRDSDLRELRARTLGGQVAGFYVPDTGDLVVRVSSGDIGPLERVALVHELEHALADQVLDLPVPEEITPGREDADLAAVALVEGDATLTMQRYAGALPLEDQIGLLDPEAIAASEAGLADLPYYLEQELLFPYQEGLSFVCDLYGRGGWGAVDRAYRRPPVSSAQILFPERYRAGEDAVDPRDTGRPGAPWRLEETRQFGAASLLWLLEAPGGDPARSLEDPLDGAAAWAGGELRLWTRGGDTAVGIALAERDGQDVLCSAVSHWYAAAFPGARPSGSATGNGLLLDGTAQDAALACRPAEVRLGIAPDPATARRLASGPAGR